MRSRLLKTLLCWGVVWVAMLGACGNDDGGVGPGAPGSVQLAATSYDAVEGTIVNLPVARSGGSDGLASVDYATVDGTAVGGADYAAASGTLTWPDGLSGNQTISIAIAADGTVERPESFAVTLGNVSGAALGANASATVTIIDND